MAAIRAASASWLRRLPDGLIDIVLLWLVLRVGLSLIAAVLFVGGGLNQPCVDPNVDNHWITLPPLANQGIAWPLVGIWEHWDACWYAKIAYWGYEPGVASTTFFPLLPMLMAAGSTILGDVSLAALVINGIALVVALFGLRQLVQRDFDIETADRAVLYQVLFPVAFFFFAPYTEALFLAGSVWALLGARRRSWKVAGFAGLAAGLARPLGLVLILPLGWEAAMALRYRMRGASDRTEWIGWRDLGPFVAATTPAIAYVTYLAFTALVVGEPYDVAHNSFIGQTTGLRAPWETIALAWNRLLQLHEIVTLLNLVVLFLFAGLFLAGLRRLPASYSLLVLPQLLLITSQVPNYPLQSAMRYLLVLFPCLVMLALEGRRQWVHLAWALLSTLFLGLLTTLFLQGTFIA
jgi:hypothetical protein